MQHSIIKCVVVEDHDETSFRVPNGFLIPAQHELVHLLLPSVFSRPLALRSWGGGYNPLSELYGLCTLVLVCKDRMGPAFCCDSSLLARRFLAQPSFLSICDEAHMMREHAHVPKLRGQGCYSYLPTINKCSTIHRGGFIVRGCRIQRVFAFLFL